MFDWFYSNFFLFFLAKQIFCLFCFSYLIASIVTPFAKFIHRYFNSVESFPRNIHYITIFFLKNPKKKSFIWIYSFFLFKCVSFRLIQIQFLFFLSFCHIATGITAAQKSEILEAHNRLRSQVAQGRVPGQPSAQNMREMVWDDELAAKAQQWANQCIFEHDPNRYIGKFVFLAQDFFSFNFIYQCDNQ